MHPPQRVSLAVEGFFERPDALINIRLGDGLSVFLGLLPLMKGETESIQLRFETGKTLLESGIILIHRDAAR